MIARRTVLGVAALALLPWRARAAGDDLRMALDTARANHDPAIALRMLAGFDATHLAPSPQLDLLTARAGLAVDVALRTQGSNPALLLRRKLGDGIDLAASAARLEHERALCEARAALLFDRIGVTGSTTGARFSALWRDAADRYPDSDAGCDAAVADTNHWLDRFRRAVPALIGPVPGYCLNVVSRRGGPGEPVGVRALPTPGNPGSYTIDLTHVADRPRWTLASVAAHELLPGHMIQLPIEAAADPHPLRLEYAPAFAEGWGIYAERLVARSGAYAANPRAELGQLHWRLFRIGRALVDLDIHLRGLSLDAARARLVAWQGEPVAFAPFNADLARIAHDPMTRAAEMLAALAIEDGARGRSGAGLHRYHRIVLENGRMRSDELARRVSAVA